MQAKERLFLNADKTRVVPEGHKAAAFLYAAPGDEIPQSAAEQFGIKDGKAPGKKRGGGEDKSRKDGSDKDGQNGGNKNAPPSQTDGGAGNAAGSAQPADLTLINGIGPATAEALAALGFAALEKLASVDLTNPPDIGRPVKGEDWASWKDQAAALAAAPEKATGRLTVNTLKKDD